MIGYGVMRRDLALSRIGRVLEAKNQGVVSNEFGVILLGGFIDRGETAAEEVRAGRIRKLVWGRVKADKAERLGYVSNESEYLERLLLKQGIASRYFIKLDSCENSSTRDEAECAYIWFRDHPPFPARLTIVTSWFHTRRARWIFRKVWRDQPTQFDTVSAFDSEAPPDRWWEYEDQGFSVINEYIKWVYYMTHYRKDPWAIREEK